MADSIEITADIQQYLGENSSDLLMLSYQAMEVWNDVTVFPNVKNKIRTTTMIIDEMVKPYTGNFDPKQNVIKFVPREMGVQLAQADLKVNPEDYRQTYLAEFQGKGVKRSPDELPFAQYVWQQVFEAFGEELNNSTAYNGAHNAAGTAAVDVADGFGTVLASMITAGDVAPISTGAIVSGTAIDQLKEMYRSIPEKYRTKRWNLHAYMARDTYEAYVDSLDNKNWNTGRGDDYLGPKYLRGSDGILTLHPVSWMAGSGRVIMTPFKNIVMLADAIDQDLAKMNIVQDVWFAKVGIACALGFDFRYGGLIWCNDVA